MNPVRTVAICMAGLMALALGIYSVTVYMDPNASWKAWIEIGALAAGLVALVALAVTADEKD